MPLKKSVKMTSREQQMIRPMKLVQLNVISSDEDHVKTVNYFAAQQCKLMNRYQTASLTYDW